MKQKFTWVSLFVLTLSLLTPRMVLSFEITLSDTMPRQGDVVKIEITSQEACQIKARWNNHTFEFHSRTDSDAKYFGLMGIDYNRAPGPAQLTVYVDPCDSNRAPTSKRIRLSVRDRSFRTQRLTVADEEKITLSPENLQRVRREKNRIRAALDLHQSSPLWSIPLAAPLDRSPEGNSFGAQRIINGNPRSPHSGEDYTARVGDAIYSIGRGRVVLTGAFFFEGKAIFIDHGAGLQSMYFHLSHISVNKGQKVKAGEKIGEAGSTGRVTGPHLHLGIKLLGSTVDPDSLFQLTLPE